MKLNEEQMYSLQEDDRSEWDSFLDFPLPKDIWLEDEEDTPLFREVKTQIKEKPRVSSNL